MPTTEDFGLQLRRKARARQAVRAPETVDVLNHEAWVDIYDGFEAKGLRIEVHRDDAPKGESEYGSLKGRIIDVANGDRVGEVEYNYNGATVEHAYVRLDGAYQGRGFAGALETHLEDGYRRIGVEKIELNAAMVGSYTWATQGYTFRRPKEMWAPMLRRRARSVPGQRSAQRIEHYAGAEVLAELEDFIEGTAEFEWQIASWGREYTWVEEDGTVMWPGKAYLLWNGWSAVKEL